MALVARHHRPSRHDARLLSTARRAVNLRQGLLRLALGAAAMWFVFWTCAYVLGPQTSEMFETPPPAFTAPTVIVLIVVALFLLPWIAFAFRSD
jgi:hypothetical protein